MNVLFATPTYTGSVGVGYFAAMTQSLGILQRAGVPAGVSFVAGDPLVGRARNGLVKRFLDSDATHLFFIDADLDWDPTAPARILKAGRDAVMGIYPMKQDTLDFAVSFDVDAQGAAQMVDGLLPVKHGPGGFLCLSREGLERMIAKYPESKYEGGYNLFQTEIRDGVYWGEDTAFCERWRAAGGSLWALPDIQFGHTGPKRWAGDFWAWHRGKA